MTTKIKWGKKYTRDMWKGIIYLIPERIADGNVICTLIRTGVNPFTDSNVPRSVSNFTNTYHLMSRNIKNTSLARKMYPDAEIEGEWLVIYG